jgi:hypothetical protein
MHLAGTIALGDLTVVGLDDDALVVF